MSFMDEVKKDINKITTTDYKLNLGEQYSMAGTYGWICPVCGRGVAPDQKYCNCKPKVYPIYPTYPVYPYWWYQTTCSTTSDPSLTKATYTTSASTKVEV